jgi:hypothetical protein
VKIVLHNDALYSMFIYVATSQINFMHCNSLNNIYEIYVFIGGLGFVVFFLFLHWIRLSAVGVPTDFVNGV